MKCSSSVRGSVKFNKLQHLEIGQRVFAQTTQITKAVRLITNPIAMRWLCYFQEFSHSYCQSKGLMHEEKKQ